MTYGEAWFKVKEQNQSLNIKFDDCVSFPFRNFKHKSRMKRAEADVYYTNKINQEFERLGYKVKSKELSVKDFDSVECYYGYFEALKIINKLNLTLK